MRLVSVGINRCSGIAQGLHQVDVLINVILDRVVVVVNQDGIRPALVGHLKGFDKPVVARLATTAQGLLHHGVTRLMGTHRLVHHVNHRQGVVMFLGMVEPIGEGSEALPCRQRLQPTGILGTPHQCMELVGEVMLLGIVEGIVGSSPVEVTSATFHRRPFRLVLTGDLVPKGIKLWHAATGIHIIAGGNVTQELVRIGTQLGMGNGTPHP